MIALMGLTEIALIFLLLGNPGLPLGVPPAEPDETLFRMAPEEAIYYSMWAGVEMPDPTSPNSTERMLANPEMQQFLGKVEGWATKLVGNMGRGQDDQQRVLVELTVPLIRTMLTRPGAAFIQEMALGGDGLEADAALVLNVGPDQQELRGLLERLRRDYLQTELELQVTEVEIAGSTFARVQPNQAAAPILWGFHGDYWIVAAGDEAIAGILARMQTDEPEWLTSLRQELEVPRFATACYLNLAAVQQRVEPFMMFVPELDEALETLQVDNVTAYRCVTGLDEQGYAIRAHLATQGPVRLFDFLGQRPMLATELERVPARSPLVLALQLDVDAVRQLLVDVMQPLNPRIGDVEEAISAQFEEAIGLDLDELSQQVLDDTAMLYASPTDGGLITGWIVSIGLQDSRRAQQAADRFLGFFQGLVGLDDDVTLESTEWRGHTLFSLKVNDDDMWFTPTWAVTENELLISLFPQPLQSHLEPGDVESLAEHPQLATSFADSDPMKGEGPRFVVQIDHAEVIRLLYPLAQLVMAEGLGPLEKELGEPVTPIDLPSVAALTRETQPMVGWLTKTTDGYRWEVRETLPTGDLLTSVPVFATLGLPATIAARLAAARTQSLNHLRQIGLALHNFHDTHNAFPAQANLDEQGQPLLSWRVHILPYLGEQALYEQFHLDEPWDSPHNKKLVARMPEVYAFPGSDSRDGLTGYLGVAGKKAWFQRAKKEGQGSAADGISFRNVLDGTSNTLMVVEVNEASRVVWTKPEDLETPGMQPLKLLLGNWDEGFQGLLGDGSVAMIPSTVDEATLNKLFQIDDGQVIELPWR